MSNNYNARFKEIAPGVTSELIATRMEFSYVPKGLSTPESLTAIWWAQDFLPIGDSFQRIGDGGARMDTVLADHATKVLSVDDPVTGQTVELSATGAVKWLIKYFDYQYNLENPPPLVEEGSEGDGDEEVPSNDPIN